MSKEDICLHTSTNRNNGHIVCIDCGEVLDIDIRDGVYKTGVGFHTQQSAQYVYPGNSLGYIDRLGSDMGNSNILKDAYNNILPKEKHTDYKRLQKFSRMMFYPQFYSHINKNKNYCNFLQLELKGICKQLKINKNTMQKALYYLVKIINNEKVIPNKVSLMGYCLYYTTKLDKEYAPISLPQIIREFNELGHRLNARMLWRDALLYSEYFPEKEVSKPINYIGRYAADISNNTDVIKKLKNNGYHGDKATFRQELENMGKMMLDKLPEGLFQGCSPRNVAAMILYASGILLANKHNFDAKFLSQKNIGTSTGVHDYSIREIYGKYIKPIFIKQNLKFINKKKVKK